MGHFSFWKKLLLCRLYNLFFVSIIFLFTSCSSRSEVSLSASLSQEEKADLEYFLRALIFEHRGAFVLFGHKPLCEMMLDDTDCTMDDETFQKRLAALSEEEREQIEQIIKRAPPAPDPEHNPYKGWLALQKVLGKTAPRNYLFRIVPLKEPGGYEFLFINIQQTALVLAEHYEIFKQAAGGVDFHPLHAVFELQDADSVFWKNVFSMPNHLAKGLLFGFGLQNSLFGHWRFSLGNKKLLLPSEAYRKEIEDYLTHAPSTVSIASDVSHSPFKEQLSIPRFGAIPGDPTVEKYKKEKDRIEKIYRGKDIVEVTLRHLIGGSQEPY